MKNDNADLVRRLTAAGGFDSSPLYRHLLPRIAGNAQLLDLLTDARAGQQPAPALFGAVHLLLLRKPEEPLASYYRSVVGDAARPPDDRTWDAFIQFCARHRDELATIVGTRLVQTNHVHRSVVLLLALAVHGHRHREPVTVIEVGCSAGLNLLFDSYSYTIGSRTFGSPESPVHITVDVPDDAPLPDLTRIPPIAAAIGVDLSPVDVTNAQDREWLRALVWPENGAQAALLSEAMTIATAHPPHIIRGDAVDICRDLARTLPGGAPRLVVHTAARIHVPDERRPAFDEAIAGLGETAPLTHAWLEDDLLVAPSGRTGTALMLADELGTRAIAVCDVHLGWLEPISQALTRGTVPSTLPA